MSDQPSRILIAVEGEDGTVSVLALARLHRASSGVSHADLR